MMYVCRTIRLNGGYVRVLCLSVCLSGWLAVRLSFGLSVEFSHALAGRFSTLLRQQRQANSAGRRIYVWTAENNGF